MSVSGSLVARTSFTMTPFSSTTQIAVSSSDTHPRQDKPLRRRTRPHGALRGSPHVARTQSQMVEPARLGHADRQAARHGACPRRRRPQARRHPASHVARPNRVPLRPGGECNRRPRRNLSNEGEPQKQLARDGEPDRSRGDGGKAIPLRVSILPAGSRKVVKQIGAPRRFSISSAQSQYAAG
jgi:hypothetical protein